MFKDLLEKFLRTIDQNFLVCVIVVFGLLIWTLLPSKRNRRQ